MIPLINGISEHWFAYMGSAAFQATLLALFVLAVLRVGRRWPPALRHAILMLALCKFLVPPMLALPTGVFSRIRPQEWFQSEPARRYVAPALHYGIPPLQGIKSSAGHVSSVKDSLNKRANSATIGTLPVQRPSLTMKGKLLLLHFSGVRMTAAPDSNLVFAANSFLGYRCGRGTGRFIEEAFCTSLPRLLFDA